MISIYATTNYLDRLKAIIGKEDRLSEELVSLVDFLEQRPLPSADALLIKKGEIGFPIDWYNVQPPFLLPEFVELTEANLLGLIFAKLDNYEKAHQYLDKQNPSLFIELDFINRLKLGIPISPHELVSQYSPFEEYRLMHNQGVVGYYGATAEDFDPDKTAYYFSEALTCAPTEEHWAFTARQFSLFLADVQQSENAVRLIEDALQKEISPAAKIELRQCLCQLWMQQLTVPYDPEFLEKLKKTLWEVSQVYEQQGRDRENALLLTDAGVIANYCESWSESLGYFNRAIATFENENLYELAANAQYRKGILLFTWAKKGNPQFFRTAAETFQKAVLVFSRAEAPEVYADIQHHLGMIYAEIPDEQKKKGIWAAVSSSAFQEALEIYTKEAYPYEYAMVCNHYGNALTTYPEAKLSDNVEKALYYYQEALHIRTPEQYPVERCLTLLNYLEAQWNLGMQEDKLDEHRYRDMVQKAEEVVALAQDQDIKKEAEEHLEKLAQLKLAYA